MMKKSRYTFFTAALSMLFLFGGPAIAGGAVKKTSEAAAFEKDVDRLTDLVVTLMPLGKIFESVAKENPEWPVLDKADKVSPQQMACLRNELSVDGFRRLKRKEVAAFAESHRAEIKADIQLLESGAAELFGKLVLAGADAQRTGVEANSDAILAAATPEQLQSFAAFFEESKFLGLRKLAGVGDSLSSEKTKDENDASGEKLGQDMASDFISTSMKTCDVNLTE